MVLRIEGRESLVGGRQISKQGIEDANNHKPNELSVDMSLSLVNESIKAKGFS